MNEPIAIAVLLTVFGALLAISVLFSRASERIGIPVLLIFLLIGMLAGSEGVGGIVFEDYRFAFRLGTVALALILFDGGLNTPLSSLRQAVRPAGVLATVGVLATAALVAGLAILLGFATGEAMLLGAIVSSTDAAAVFSVLRGSGIHLKRRVGVTLEVESGINDPMAIILTMAVAGMIVDSDASLGWGLPLDVLIQFVVGAAFGTAIGFGGRALLTHLRLPAGGMYPALTIALCFLAFGLPTLMLGSGFLAVYIAGVILGNGQLPFRAGLLRVHDAVAWLSQIAMFLGRGMLVFPTRLMGAAGTGILLALFLAFIARPVVVALCLLPFRFPARETLYIGWVGLRGAVPIILASYPVLVGVPNATRIFDVVFFIVVANALLPGGTVPWVTRRLRLESREPPAPQAVLAIESMLPLNAEILSFYVDEALAVAGARIADLPFPEGAAVTLLVRGQELVPARGNTVLLAGDHVYVFSRGEDIPLIRLMFGRPEGD